MKPVSKENEFFFVMWSTWKQPLKAIYKWKKGLNFKINKNFKILFLKVQIGNLRFFFI